MTLLVPFITVVAVAAEPIAKRAAALDARAINAGVGSNLLCEDDNGGRNMERSDAALPQILNPGDPNVPFVSLIVGIANCNTAAFSSFANPWAFLAPSDGLPHGALPIPGTSRTTFTGGYGKLFPFCGEPMAFLCMEYVRRISGFGAFSQPLSAADPNGSQHPLFVVQDITRNFLAATPDPDVYASGNSAVVQEVRLFFNGGMTLEFGYFHLKRLPILMTQHF
ncbi:hypothetical protein B0H19DRAFT_1080143 [Mycena capillaripes]|nr:hypothetical protein B0H19DRAFT_1080143 [Mycena capillaripes]